jgi:hypothetical protein
MFSFLDLFVIVLGVPFWFIFFSGGACGSFVCMICFRCRYFEFPAYVFIRLHAVGCCGVVLWSAASLVGFSGIDYSVVSFLCTTEFSTDSFHNTDGHTVTQNTTFFQLIP